MGCSNTRPPHFGQGPRGVRPVKSTFSAPSPSPGLPKSNSARNSGVSRTTAAKGLPIRLRNPVIGPTDFFSISVSIKKKSVGPMTGFRSRMGKPFAAVESGHRAHGLLLDQRLDLLGREFPARDHLPYRK